jgi:hypothetical protein
MSLSLLCVRAAGGDEWDLIWRECNYATYFHSREWAEIWSAYRHEVRPEPMLLIFSDGKKALLPLSSWKSGRGLIRNRISSPAETFGGWIAADELDMSHAQLLAGYLTRRCGNLMWRLNPYDELALKANIRPASYDETHALNLTEGFDAIHRRWTKGHRSAAQKARREGVTVRLASTLDDWRVYYEVYEDSMRRWGKAATSSYDWELFEEMFRRKSLYIRLWLAVYRDVIVAGALCLYAKNHVSYWHGATLEAYFGLRPVHLLLYECIKATCEQGYKWFDFNPSGGHEGVKAFKRSFGTEVRECPFVSIQSAKSKLIKQIGRLVPKYMSRSASLHT